MTTTLDANNIMNRLRLQLCHLQEDLHSSLAVRPFIKKRPPHKIFQIHLVLSNICKFLSLEDLKKFRRVCKDWKKASEVCFKTISRVTFNSEKYSFVLIDDLEIISNEKRKRGKIRNVPSSLDEFFKSLVSSYEIPFTAIGFKGAIPWHIQLLVDFFVKGYGKSITDLKIYNPTFVDQRGNLIFGNIDISPLIPENIKRLQIQNYNENVSIYLSMSKVTFIQFLDLRNCYLQYYGKKILAIEIILHRVKIANQKQIITNNYFDFRKIRKVNFVGDRYKLDVSKDDVVVEELCLHSTENILNRENSKWKIKKGIFNLDHNISNMKIQIYETLETGKVNFSFLPTDVEKVIFNSIQEITNISDRQINLPNLTEMTLNAHYESPMLIDLKLLPSSIRDLYLSNSIQFVGDGIFELQRLTITHQNDCDLMDSLDMIVKKIKPIDLFITFTSYFVNDSWVERKLIKFIERNPNQRITVHCLQWDSVKKCMSLYPVSYAFERKEVASKDEQESITDTNLKPVKMDCRGYIKNAFTKLFK